MTGGFTDREARWVLNAGRAAGLLPRLHTCGDAASGAAMLAAEFGCASADLLHGAGDDEVAALARAGVAAVLCPRSSGVRPAARRSARCSTRAWPSLSAPTTRPGGNGITSMPLVIALAVRYFGMSVTEALRAATLGGAQALRAGGPRRDGARPVRRHRRLGRRPRGSVRLVLRPEAAPRLARRRAGQLAG